MRTFIQKTIPILFFGLFLIAFCAIGIYRYNIGQVFYYDFGIFAHIIWQLSRFQVPVINHLFLGEIIFLGDHFNPSLAIFAPLFWITSDLRILLIQQAVAVTASGVLVYAIARKSGLRHISSFATSAAYILFAGTENPLVTDWHPESTAALLLLLFVYLYSFTQKRVLYIIIFLLFLGLKESNALSASMLLVVLGITVKEKRKETAIFILASIVYFFFATKVAIPYFAHQAYIYSPDTPYSPLKLAQNFVNTPEKTKLIHESLLSFGYAPVLSGIGLLPIFSELAFRLSPNTTIFNNLTLGQHYNVLLGVFLALATISGIKKLQRWTKNNKPAEYLFACYILLVALVVARKITGSPINLAVNATFWGELQPRQSLFASLEKIPKKGSIMSQNNLLAYTVNRIDEVFLLNEEYEQYKPKIIVFDESEDQNINNFYGSKVTVLEEIKPKLANDPSYKRIETPNNKIYIYVRK